MELIKKDNAVSKNSSEVCEVLEYSFENRSMDLGVATLTGRYPEKGYCVNLVSKELAYVLEGTGILHFENKSVCFSAGDAVLIESGEKYYWQTDYCRVAMICTPAWDPEQYKLI